MAEVEIMRMQKGERMDHHMEDSSAPGVIVKRLKYNGMSAQELAMARNISKTERLAKEAKEDKNHRTWVDGRVK